MSSRPRRSTDNKAIKQGTSPENRKQGYPSKSRSRHDYPHKSTRSRNRPNRPSKSTNRADNRKKSSGSRARPDRANSQSRNRPDRKNRSRSRSITDSVTTTPSRSSSSPRSRRSPSSESTASRISSHRSSSRKHEQQYEDDVQSECCAYTLIVLRFVLVIGCVVTYIWYYTSEKDVWWNLHKQATRWLQNILADIKLCDDARHHLKRLIKYAEHTVVVVALVHIAIDIVVMVSMIVRMRCLINFTVVLQHLLGLIVVAVAVTCGGLLFDEYMMSERHGSVLESSMYRAHKYLKEHQCSDGDGLILNALQKELKCCGIEKPKDYIDLHTYVSKKGNYQMGISTKWSHSVNCKEANPHEFAAWGKICLVPPTCCKNATACPTQAVPLSDQQKVDLNLKVRSYYETNNADVLAAHVYGVRNATWGTWSEASKKDLNNKGCAGEMKKRLIKMLFVVMCGSLLLILTTIGILIPAVKLISKLEMAKLARKMK